MKLNNLILTTYLFLCCLTCLDELHAQVGMGTNSPSASAVLDLVSTKKGFLPPRMTYAQMTSIVSPTVGLMLYCTDCEPEGIYYYESGYFLNSHRQAVSGNIDSFEGRSITHNGNIDAETLYFDSNGVTTSFNFSGWSGDTHNPIRFHSTGRLGFTATLTNLLNNTATFRITGKPILPTGSDANFNVSIGGQTFMFSRVIYIGSPVLENGLIPDNQLSVSTMANSNFPPTNGRLNTTGPNWAVYVANTAQWYQVDLGQTETIVGVATQGANASSQQWIKSYRLQYSSDGTTFTNYNSGTPLTGNTDQNTVVRHNLNPSITARYIRFNPQTWKTYIQGRFEVYIE